MLPSVNFCGIEITRLTIGNNPFSGHSYIPKKYTRDEMLDYYTAERICETLFEAEKCGINTYQALACPFIYRVIRQYRNNGGKMNIIFQTHSAIDLNYSLRQLLPLEPVAIYLQGAVTDGLIESGEIDVLKDKIRLLRETGLPIGLSTHRPEHLLMSEREGWDVDFYMACLYNARRPVREDEKGYVSNDCGHIVFYPEDRFITYKAINSTKKPCIAYKILAGGQIFNGGDKRTVLRECFREVYENIKPGDIATIGVFQRDENQLRENTDILREILT